MSDVFISHVEEDADVALGIALKLEEAGYTTWCYELDSIPGPSYLLQTGAAIEQSKVVVLVISAHSLGSRQVTREIVRAHESGANFVPVLRDITHVEFQNRQPEWREALGSATSILIPQEGIAGIYHRILDGLKALGIHPTSKPDNARLERIRQAFNEIPSSSEIKEAIKPEFKYTASPVPSVKIPGRVGKKALFKLRSRWAWAVAGVVVIVAVLGIWLYLGMTDGDDEALSITLLSSFSTSREVNSVFVIDDTAYLANGGDGLIVLDVNTPSEPRKIGQYLPEITESDIRSVVVVDDMAYVTQQGGLQDNKVLRDRLLLLDVGIPSNPIKLGEYEHDEHRSLDKVAVAGDIAYLPTSNRLVLVDISNPSSPVKLGELDYDSNVAYPGVSVVRDIVYMMANNFHVIDVRDTSKPTQIGQFDTSDWGSAVAVVNKTAYVVGWAGGLEIIDVSVPSHPVKLGRYKGEGSYELLPPGAEGRYTMMDTCIAGDTAYVTCSFGVDHGTWTEILDSGFIAIDVSDPGNPVKIAEYPGMEDISSIFVTGDLLFATDATRGLFIFNLKGG